MPKNLAHVGHRRSFKGEPVIPSKAGPLGIQQLARKVPGATHFVLALFRCSARTRVRLMVILFVEFSFVSWAPC